jgi:hypothetical protein
MTYAIEVGETKRQCGGCTLCCRLLPVSGIDKPGGVRCRHQRFKTSGNAGCAVYRKEGFPGECALWSCQWLVVPTLDVPRPDHAHYVIDIVPDYITARNDYDLTKEITAPIIQIWCDPHYPEAHRDPRLRKWLELQSLEGWCALVRFSPTEALFLIPPRMSDKGVWEEKSGVGMERAEAHTAEEIAAKLHNAGIMPA